MFKTGIIFGEHVSTETIKRRGNYLEDKKQKGMRFYLIPAALGILLFLVLSRMVFLQIVNGSYYRTLSDSNRIKTVIIHAPRGIIFDRNAKPLVFNIPGFRQTISGKTKLIGRDEALSLLGKGEELEIDSLRQYPYKEATSHILGYLGQISEEELDDPSFEDYGAGEVIGKMGIEAKYEKFLKGVDGKKLVEVDSTGKVIRDLGKSDPIPGKNIKITLDLELQKKTYEAMKDIKKGAVIATTPKGEVLVLVSLPSFDPNLFTQGSDYKPATESSYLTIDEILNDSKSQPLLNRPISGRYPPGSTFKIVTAAAGLEEGVIDTSYTVEDTGILRIGEFSFANWYFTDYGRTEGEINVVKGIRRSNDIFFYKLAEKVGLEKLSDMAREFQIDEVLGIDLEGEAGGLVPTNDWKIKNIGEPWYLGDTYHIGIGQGYLLSTPLSVNSWAQVIAAGGTLYRPHVFKDLGQKVLNKNLLSQKTVEPIKQGMIQSCSTGGVAYPLFNFKVKNENLKIDGKNFLPAPESTASAKQSDVRIVTVACKTGTAQHGGEKTLPHAWITLFAPAYNPEIVVTVLAEESGEGSSVAAPIAKEILEEWFLR